MNSVLVMLNVMALVTFIGFQFHTQANDPALVHIDAARLIPAPVARVAASGPERPVMAAQGVNETATTRQSERYVF